MDKAYSLYKSVTYEANDSILNYESYKEFGLVCENCSTPVFFRQRGCDGRKAHFAHFTGIESEGCEFKINNFNRVNYFNNTEKINQSLQKFQEYFLNMFIVSYPDFYTGIKKTKDRLTDLVYTSPCIHSYFNYDSPPIELLLDSYRNELLEVKNSSFQRKKEYNIALTPFEKLVNFLCLESNRELLCQLNYYILFKFYDQSCCNINRLKEWGDLIEWVEMYTIYLFAIINSTFFIKTTLESSRVF